MKKYKLFFDPRKEEDWLNSLEGYQLTKVNFISYTFEKSKKKYDYSVNYTAGHFEYLSLLNNMKNGVYEIKHSIGWTYLKKEQKIKTFYRSEEEHKRNLKLFVRKYSLYCRSFLMFGFASLVLSISVNKYFIICSVLLFLLSLLYSICIKTTKKQINNDIIKKD